MDFLFADDSNLLYSLENIDDIKKINNKILCLVEWLETNRLSIYRWYKTHYFYSIGKKEKRLKLFWKWIILLLIKFKV